MEEKKQRPVITAACCHCGTKIQFYLPEKAGIIRLTCKNPACGKQFAVKINEKIITLGNSPKTTESDAKQNAQGTPHEQPQQNDVKQNNQEASPLEEVEHEKTEPVHKYNESAQPHTIAHLKQPRGLFRRDLIFPLSLGENTIGRRDASKPSKIMIEGDSTVSRRSVSITVTERDGDYEYLFTLLSKPKNRILVDGKEYTEPPASFVIYPGAEIKLGRTRLILTL